MIQYVAVPGSNHPPIHSFAPDHLAETGAMSQSLIIKAIMNLLVYVSALVILQSVLGSNCCTDLACEKLRLVANRLDLLTTKSLEPAMPGNEQLAPDTLPCELPWKVNRIILKQVDPPPGESYDPEIYYRQDPNLSGEQIKGKVLLIQEKAVGSWRSSPMFLHLNDHVFGLIGGVFENNKGTAAFLLDLSNQSAQTLEAEYQGEALTIQACYINLCPVYYTYLGFSQKYLCELTRQGQERGVSNFSLKALFYHDLGLVEKAAEFPNIPLRQEHLPRNKVILPKIVNPITYRSPEIFFTIQSMSLIRIMQMIKYFKSAFAPDFYFENPAIQVISDSIDTYTTALSKEEKEGFFEEILLRANDLIISPPTIPSCLNALICHDEKIRGLFLNPGPDADSLYPFGPSFDFSLETFSDSAWEQILSYDVDSQFFPLTLKLNIKGNQNAEFVPFAFIDYRNSVLYILRETGDYLAVNIYGKEDDVVVLNMYLERDAENKPTLLTIGNGIVFYRHRPSRFASTKSAPKG